MDRRGVWAVEDVPEDVGLLVCAGLVCPTCWITVVALVVVADSTMNSSCFLGLLSTSDNDASNIASLYFFLPSSSSFAFSGLLAPSIPPTVLMRWIIWDCLFILPPTPTMGPSSSLLSSSNGAPFAEADTTISVRLRLRNDLFELGKAGGGPNPTGNSSP